MLGFSVHVERVMSDAESITLASWMADGTALWDNLVRLGRATLVVNRGGYPDRYEVVAREILHLFEPTVRDELPDVLELKPGWELILKDDAVAACPPDAVLTVTVWDQS